jgi:hypothetical protein
MKEAAAFNGQPGRQRLFLGLMRAIRFDEIVETGAFRGDTVAFMAARSGLPVFASECSRGASAIQPLVVRNASAKSSPKNRS